MKGPEARLLAQATPPFAFQSGRQADAKACVREGGGSAVCGPLLCSGRQAADFGAQGGELLGEAGVAPVQVIDPMHFGGALGGQAGHHQGG